MKVLIGSSRETARTEWINPGQITRIKPGATTSTATIVMLNDDHLMAWVDGEVSGEEAATRLGVMARQELRARGGAQ